MLAATVDHDDVSAGITAQVPYWVAVLTPEERSFGTRRTDPRIDTVDSSVVSEISTQWAGSEHPSFATLLAVLAATVGAWQSDRCRSCTSGVLVDIAANPDIGTCSDGSALFPVRLPTTGHTDTLVAEVRRRVAAAPNDGTDFAEAKYTFGSPALARKAGAQIAFLGTAGTSATPLSDADEALHHSLTVRYDVSEIDGVTTVDAEFRWNSRIFTRSDVDDFERFWEKTLSAFA
nr:hypothetical protein [Rhodococcus sp. (in: high G+C Gram-positive bacteria)]